MSQGNDISIAKRFLHAHACCAIAKICYQPRCLSADEQKCDMYMYKGILLSHQQNDILSFAEKWMELKVIMLSEIRQTQKDKYHIFSLIGETSKSTL